MAKTKAEKVDDILTNLQTDTPGIESAMLISMDDGLIISTTPLPTDIEEDVVSAMVATMLGMGERATDNLNKGELNKVLVEGQNGKILLISAGKEAVLAVITTQKARLGMIFLEARHATDKLVEIMS